MATQSLEFNATSGLTITAKLFALEADTVVASVVATEKTNDKGRYVAAFTNIAAADYRLNGFIGASGGFANEIYTLTLTTDVFFPWSELFSATLAAKIALIGTGVPASVAMPVDAASGVITSPIIIGDDYLDANGRAFVWTVAAVTGFAIGTCTCWFGGKSKSDSSHWLIQGATPTLNGISWRLAFDMTKVVSGALTAGMYDWSVEVKDVAGTEITRVRNAEFCRVQVLAKQT